MPSIALPVVDVHVHNRGVLVSSPVTPAATPYATPTSLTVTPCTQAGADFTALEKAEVLTIKWSYNGPKMVTFTVPFDEPQIAGLFLVTETDGAGLNREIKVHRNGVLLFRGPCVTRRADSVTRQWTYTAFDKLWYLLHRFFGEATRHNYLTNGSFDLPDPTGGFGSWGQVGAPTGAIDSVQFLQGLNYGYTGHSADLLAGSTDEIFIYQNFVATSGPIGLAFILTAWVFIDTMNAPAIFARGAFIQRVGASGPGAIGEAKLSIDTERGQWIRLTCGVWMPPNKTETIQTRLYVPNGEVHWDAVTVVVQESVSFIPQNSPGGVGWDQTAIAQQIVRYASGSLAIGDPYNKSQLHLAVAGAPSGIKKTRTYQFFDHQPVYAGGFGSGALDQFVAATDGFDFRVEDTETVSTFRTFWPAVGFAWNPVDLTFEYVRTVVAGVPTGSYKCVTAWTFDESAEGAANDVTVMGGWGDGAGREEGGAFLPYFGDLTLEKVDSAPAEASLDLLDKIALQEAQQLAVTQKALVLTIVEPRDPVTNEVTQPLIGVLMPGDLVLTTIDDAGMFTSDAARVLEVTYDARTETLSVPVLPNGTSDRAGNLWPF